MQLRSWLPSDAQAVWEACQDEGIRSRLPVPDPYELAHARAFITEVVPGIEAAGGVARAIVLEGRVVGSITLRPTPDGAGRRGRVGYWVAASARGRGVAPAAVRALGIEFERYQEVELLTAANNAASQAVAGKCGFTLVQEISSEPLVGGGPARRFLRRTPPSTTAALAALSEGRGAVHHPRACSVLPTSQGVALTFDDGPDPIYTVQLLDLLAAREVHATFFVLGEAVERSPEIVRRAAAEGHRIGVHGYDHTPMIAGRNLDHLERCVGQLEALGVTPRLFRPAYGELDDTLLDRVDALGLTPWLWSVDSFDWTRPPSTLLARHVLAHAGPGDVVLLHDGRGDRSASVEATALLLDHLDECVLLPSE